MTKKTEEQWYVVPEIEVRVHESWVNLVTYCRDNLQHGDLRIKIANAQPTKRLKETPVIRFDRKTPKSITDGMWYVIPSLDVRVHEYWINLIQWCQSSFVSGELEIRLVGGQPIELISAKQDVRFDKPETIPNGIPLNFVRTQ